jgi:hypothetical protein
MSTNKKPESWAEHYNFIKCSMSIKIRALELLEILLKISKIKAS